MAPTAGLPVATSQVPAVAPSPDAALVGDVVAGPGWWTAFVEAHRQTAQVQAAYQHLMTEAQVEFLRTTEAMCARLAGASAMDVYAAPGYLPAVSAVNPAAVPPSAAPSPAAPATAMPAAAGPATAVPAAAVPPAEMQAGAMPGTAVSPVPTAPASSAPRPADPVQAAEAMSAPPAVPVADPTVAPPASVTAAVPPVVAQGTLAAMAA
ncbi:hypothetical protein ND748_32935, partial [Frankia sp. AiPs1]|nr:hypothetical protein [Frankia sp. AiPs1]